MTSRQRSFAPFGLFVLRPAVLGALAAGLAAGQAPPGFTDVTAAAGVTFVFGANLSTPSAGTSGGGTEGDFNDDGWPDLFVVGGGGAHDHLFMNNGDGTFTDKAISAGLSLLYRGFGASAADYDNDGDLDIYVTSMGDYPNTPVNGKHKLWRNNGNTTFTNVASSVGLNSTGSYPDGFGVTWGDYDLDGDMDVYVAGWETDPVSGFTANNRLFRNNLAGSGTANFTDVTSALGLFTTQTYGFGGVFVDMDGDRYPELLVAGDFNSSKYYKNNANGTFTEEWPMAVGDTKVDNGMGTTIGDFNRDGLPDWFVTAIDPAWHAGGPDGNRLYMNLGGGTIQSLPDTAGVNDGGWGWGTSSIDFDNDGWQDIVMTNGSQFCPDVVTGACFINDPSYLFHNNGDSTFTEVHALENLVDPYQGRGLITFDYDRDGDMDVVILSNSIPGPGDDPATGNLKLFRNNICGPGGPTTDANYLEITLDTAATPGLAPNGWGADVRVTTGSVVQHDRITGGSNYLSRSQLVAHFGLGSSRVADDITVTWPDGTTSQLTNVNANQLITISSPPPTWFNLGQAKAGSNGVPALSGTGNLSPNSFNQLSLANAVPSTTATLVYGLAPLNGPFKGGVMVPAPLSFLPLPTSPAGTTALPFLFPPGVPPGFPIYFQFWISDPPVASHFSASNGLKGVTS